MLWVSRKICAFWELKKWPCIELKVRLDCTTVCKGQAVLCFLFFLTFILYWSIVELQCCVSFGVQQSDLVIHIHVIYSFFRFLSHIGYYRILSRVPCAICNRAVLCVLQCWALFYFVSYAGVYWCFGHDIILTGDHFVTK